MVRPPMRFELAVSGPPSPVVINDAAGDRSFPHAQHQGFGAPRSRARHRHEDASGSSAARRLDRKQRRHRRCRFRRNGRQRRTVIRLNRTTSDKRLAIQLPGPTSCHPGNYGAQLPCKWEPSLGGNTSGHRPRLASGCLGAHGWLCPVNGSPRSSPGVDRRRCQAWELRIVSRTTWGLGGRLCSERARRPVRSALPRLQGRTTGTAARSQGGSAAFSSGLLLLAHSDSRAHPLSARGRRETSLTVFASRPPFSR
jgi:hypothetical protein